MGDGAYQVCTDEGPRSPEFAREAERADQPALGAVGANDGAESLGRRADECDLILSNTDERVRSVFVGEEEACYLVSDEGASPTAARRRQDAVRVRMCGEVVEIGYDRVTV